MADVMMWRPLSRDASATPRIARLSASVAPLVKTISLGRAPMARATSARASCPYAWRLLAFPAFSEKKGSMASRTRGSTGVVAAWSRYTLTSVPPPRSAGPSRAGPGGGRSGPGRADGPEGTPPARAGGEEPPRLPEGEPAACEEGRQGLDLLDILPRVAGVRPARDPPHKAAPLPLLEGPDRDPRELGHDGPVQEPQGQMVHFVLLCRPFPVYQQAAARRPRVTAPGDRPGR